MGPGVIHLLHGDGPQSLEVKIFLQALQGRPGGDDAALTLRVIPLHSDDLSAGITGEAWVELRRRTNPVGHHPLTP